MKQPVLIRLVVDDHTTVDLQAQLQPNHGSVES